VLAVVDVDELVRQQAAHVVGVVRVKGAPKKRSTSSSALASTDSSERATVSSMASWRRVQSRTVAGGVGGAAGAGGGVCSG